MSPPGKEKNCFFFCNKDEAQPDGSRRYRGLGVRPMTLEIRQFGLKVVIVLGDYLLNDPGQRRYGESNTKMFFFLALVWVMRSNRSICLFFVKP